MPLLRLHLLRALVSAPLKREREKFDNERNSFNNAKKWKEKKVKVEAKKSRKAKLYRFLFVYLSEKRKREMVGERVGVPPASQ